jgi:tetrahydromethanopterin S-methyltransferase subunit F
MKISDIFRQVADAIDQQENPGIADERLQNRAEMMPASAGVEVDNVDNQDAGADDEVMVPPLQLKIELLKRAVGVDNVYDDQRADQVTDNSDDELAAIKRNAGIDSGGMIAAIHGIAGEDEPLDD